MAAEVGSRARTVHLSFFCQNDRHLQQSLINLVLSRCTLLSQQMWSQLVPTMVASLVGPGPCSRACPIPCFLQAAWAAKALSLCDAEVSQTRG